VDLLEKIESFLKIDKYIYGYGKANGDGNGNGDGDGYGNGYGDGNGDGNGHVYGDGYGYGNGHGNDHGYGDGDGNGNGNGYGDGDGDGYGNGYGDGNGDGNGYGNGYGYGDGNGDGNGYGNGYGYGKGIKMVNKMSVVLIDNTQTAVKSIKENILSGYILNYDMTLKKCYVAKIGNKFAHGYTIKQALESAKMKVYEDMDVDERIEEFMKNFPSITKKYSAKDFYDWHNILTISCVPGRDAFLKKHGIDVEKDTFTVLEFIEKTENDFEGHIIKKLKKRIEQDGRK